VLPSPNAHANVGDPPQLHSTARLWNEIGSFVAPLVGTFAEHARLHCASPA